MTSAPPTTRTDSSPPLVPGLAALAALGVLVVLTAVVVVGGGHPLGVDVHVHHWVVTHRSMPLVHVAEVVTWVGSGWVAGPLLFVAVLAVTPGPGRQRLTAAALLTAVLAVGSLARLATADLIERPRPPASDWAVSVSGYAFPSGHTTGATLLSALLGWVALRRVTTPAGRAAVRIVAVATAVTVGATRVYLGVHWPTDVVGGWAFGLAFAGAGLVVLHLTGWTVLPGRQRG